jgi:hypothetical protein
MIRTLKRALRPLNLIWQLHPATHYVVGASRAVVLQTLVTAAKPSQYRLHLRDVFADGRHYDVQPTHGGFRITSQTVTRRNGERRRSRHAAALIGRFIGDETVTVVSLRGQAFPLYPVPGILFPAFIASIIVYMPWQIGLRVGALALLLGLALLRARLEAAVEVGAMVFFTQKALDDLPPVHAPELTDTLPGVVVRVRQHDFMHEWDKFYEAQQDDAW